MSGELFGLIIALAILVFGSILAHWISDFIYAPLLSICQKPRPPIQFSIIEMWVLGLQCFLFWMVLVHLIPYDANTSSQLVLLFAIAVSLFVACWLWGLSVLGAAHIKSTPVRAAGLFIILAGLMISLFSSYLVWAFLIAINEWMGGIVTLVITVAMVYVMRAACGWVAGYSERAERMEESSNTVVSPDTKDGA